MSAHSDCVHRHYCLLNEISVPACDILTPAPTPIMSHPLYSATFVTFTLFFLLTTESATSCSAIPAVTPFYPLSYFSRMSHFELPQICRCLPAPNVASITKPSLRTCICDDDFSARLFGFGEHAGVSSYGSDAPQVADAAGSQESGEGLHDEHPDEVQGGGDGNDDTTDPKPMLCPCETGESGTKPTATTPPPTTTKGEPICAAAFDMTFAADDAATLYACGEEVAATSVFDEVATTRVVRPKCEWLLFRVRNINLSSGLAVLLRPASFAVGRGVIGPAGFASFGNGAPQQPACIVPLEARVKVWPDERCFRDSEKHCDFDGWTEAKFAFGVAGVARGEAPNIHRLMDQGAYPIGVAGGFLGEVVYGVRVRNPFVC